MLDSDLYEASLNLMKRHSLVECHHNVFLSLHPSIIPRSLAVITDEPIGSRSVLWFDKGAYEEAFIAMTR